MGAPRKILLTVAALLVLYFFALQAGLVATIKAGLPGNGNLEKVQELDSAYGAGSSLLLPGSPKDLAEYEAKLRALQLRGNDEKSIVLLKLELVAMEKSTQAFSAQITKITSGDSCAGYPALSAAYNDAVLHANSVLSLSKTAGSVKGFEYLGSQQFRDKVDAVVKALAGSMDHYKVLC